MKIIIFAGGTGKRFWPASRKDNPKQFLPVIEDKPLIRLKYEYLNLGYKPEDIFLSTGKQYEKEVHKILPELPDENFIFEPEMRDTGSAVAYAVAYVAKKHPNEVVCTQWSDHYIKNPQLFIHALKESEKIVLENDLAVIVGVPARFPSPHRGYIKFGRKIRSLDGGDRLTLCEFTRFVEKPTLEVAKEYLQSGDYSWNPGYWVAKPNLILEKYKKFAPDIHSTITEIADDNFSNKAQKKFAELEKVSADYIFAENLNPEEAMVVNADMGWSDVGEWVALKETQEDSRDANVISGNAIDLESKDTLVYNTDSKKLVATIGLDGMIVVNTPDVVAVFHKDDNAKLKKLLKKLEEKNQHDFL